MKPRLSLGLIDDITMILLAIISIVLLIYEVVSQQSAEQKYFIRNLDIIVGCIFLVEFCIHFIRAKEKRHFFYTRWWELLAAIPLIAPLRALKFARFLPVLQGLRFIRLAYRTRLLLEATRWYSEHAYIVYIATIVTSIISLGAFGFHVFEYGHNPNVHHFFDSVWWAIVTTTTIGYGDIYPVTTGGRIIAILLIFSGIGAFGALIGFIDQYVIVRNKERLFGTSRKKA